MARDNWMCSDTLYVVTGAYWNPGSTFATPDIDGKQCPVPNYYFKVFVRTVKGNVRQAGDRLGDYPADQLKSIGFWVENAGGQGTARSWVKAFRRSKASRVSNSSLRCPPPSRRRKTPPRGDL